MTEGGRLPGGKVKGVKPMTGAERIRNYRIREEEKMGINTEQLVLLKKGDTVISGYVGSDRHIEKTVVSKGRTGGYLTIAVLRTSSNGNVWRQSDEKIRLSDLERSESVWPDLESYNRARNQYLVDERFKEAARVMWFRVATRRNGLTTEQKLDFIGMVESFGEKINAE